MRETETQHFYDFWIVGRVGTLIYGFEYTRLLKKYIRNMGTWFEHIIFGNLNMLEITNSQFWKRVGWGAVGAPLLQIKCWWVQKQLALTIVWGKNGKSKW